ALRVFNEKMSAKDFDSSLASQRSVIEKIDDNIHTFKNDRAKIYESIENMPRGEQERYRTDADFRKQVNDKIDEAFRFAPQKAKDLTTGMLNNLPHNKPTLGINETLNKYASDPELKRTDLIRDLQDQFRRNPEQFKTLQDKESPERQEFDRLIK